MGTQSTWGLISRVSSRTYRRRIIIMPDQAVANHSRSASYAKKVLYKRKRWATSGEKAAAPKTGQVGRAQRFYPVDQERRRFKTTAAGKKYQGAKKLKEGIVPGSVLILVAGRHRGKRVVFMKQLESGLLLVTGPFISTVSHSDESTRNTSSLPPPSSTLPLPSQTESTTNTSAESN